MICVILTASDDVEALARLLTQLTPAAAEGLVRQVAVVGAAGACADLAEDAGADIFAAGAFGAAAAKARGPWLAGLPSNAVLARDWMERVAGHLARGDSAPARLVARSGWLGLGGRPEGWLAPKRLAPSAVLVEQDFQRLARRGGRRLRVLDRR
jgi:hypothetical protein